MPRVYVSHRLRVPANLLTMQQVAERLKLTYDAIRHYRKLGLMPEPAIVIGALRQPAWEPDVIDRWDARRRHNPRSTVALRGQLEPLPPRERTKRVASPARKSPGQGPNPSPEFLAEFEAWKARTRR